MSEASKPPRAFRALNSVPKSGDGKPSAMRTIRGLKYLNSASRVIRKGGPSKKGG